MSNVNEQIRTAFAGGKAFIPFITCGDPDIETTEKVVRAMAEEGAAIIELGIPFSDPTVEGPIIQEAGLRALASGTKTDDCFELVRRLRQPGADGSPAVTAPILFMTYANVIFSYGGSAKPGAGNFGGTGTFLKKASAAGVQGIIVPDVPFEEKDEFQAACDAVDLCQILMVAPTSKDRVRQIARGAQGFLYCASSPGASDASDTQSASAMVDLVREVSDIPCAIDYSIETPDEATTMAACADGIIIDTPIVGRCADKGADCVNEIRAYVREMVAALHA